MRDEVVVESPVNNVTLGEKWKKPVQGHWYEAGCRFAAEHLKGTGDCLVVGSPEFEVIALQAAGW